MSANTRHSVSGSTRLAVADLADHCKQLIRDRKRSPQMVTSLMNALQLFKENRLAVAIPIPSAQVGTLPHEQAVSLLSIEMRSSTLSREGKKWCRERGLKYLGELLRVKLDLRAEVSHEIAAFIHTLGLIPGQSLENLEWQPPYATDPVVRDLWSREIGDVFSVYWLIEAHRKGLHFVGQYLGTRVTSPGELRRLQQCIRPAFMNQVHAGMLIANWSVPETPSEEWPVLEEGLRVHGENSGIDKASSDQLCRLARLIDESGDDPGLSVEVFLRLAGLSNLRECLAETTTNVIHFLHRGHYRESLHWSGLTPRQYAKMRAALEDFGLWPSMSVKEFEARLAEARALIIR